MPTACFYGLGYDDDPLMWELAWSCRRMSIDGSRRGWVGQQMRENPRQGGLLLDEAWLGRARRGTGRGAA